jgi:hypothetical protein
MSNIKHANELHQERLTRNERIGVWVTRHVGTMMCAYLFTIIGIASLIGAFTNNAQLVLIFGGISSYFIQLVLLPIIMVGTQVQSKHDAARADLQFEMEQRMHIQMEVLTAYAQKIEEEVSKKRPPKNADRRR